MMEGYQRYAVYYAPEEGSRLEEFGNRWLGIDPASGSFLPRITLPNLSEDDIITSTTDPTRYGFHGTLKPPFALSEGGSVYDLDLALQALAGRLQVIETGPLLLKRIGTFLCLGPSAPFDALNDLAAEVVRELDRFRGPQSAAQLAKRRAKGLSARQEGYLQRYGYPYVIEEFRFHLTLSNSLGEGMLDKLQAELRVLTEEFTKDPFQIRELCLFADPGCGEPFRLLKRYALAGRSK